MPWAQAGHTEKYVAEDTKCRATCSWSHTTPSRSTAMLSRMCWHTPLWACIVHRARTGTNSASTASRSESESNALLNNAFIISRFSRKYHVFPASAQNNICHSMPQVYTVGSSCVFTDGSVPRCLWERKERSKKSSPFNCRLWNMRDAPSKKFLLISFLTSILHFQWSQ